VTEKYSLNTLIERLCELEHEYAYRNEKKIVSYWQIPEYEKEIYREKVRGIIELLHELKII
jgi:hypothetical protein